MQLFNMQRLIAFLPLIKVLLAQQQALSASEAQAIAWRSYGDFVTNYMLAGQPLTQGKDFVFVLPPTSAAVRGGTPCPEAVTNNDLFLLADPLQSGPLLDNSGPGYNQGLDYYLGSIDLGTVNLTPAQTAQIQTLSNNVQTTNDKFLDVDDTAYAKYLADVRAQAAKQTYSAWIIAKYPSWTTARDNMDQANAALQQYKLNIYGPAYNTITKLKNKVELLSQDTDSPQNGSVSSLDYSWVNGTLVPIPKPTSTLPPSPDETDPSPPALLNNATDYNFTVRYNMPSYGGNYNVQFKPFAQHDLTDGIRYSPLYSLSGGFEEACDAWINGTQKPFSYTWSMKNTNSRDWTALGHSTSNLQVGGSLFSILSASHGSSSVTDTFNQWTTSFSTDISLTLTMNGAPLVFPVNSGPWDVPAVRQTFPKLTAKGIDQLTGHIKMTKVLIGHQVACTITFNDASTWKSVSQFIQDAKKDTSGGLSIWGFHFGGGGSSTTHRNITDVQVKDLGSNKGQIIIPASPLGIPMMLGAMGKAL